MTNRTHRLNESQFFAPLPWTLETKPYEARIEIIDADGASVLVFRNADARECATAAFIVKTVNAGAET